MPVERAGAGTGEGRADGAGTLVGGDVSAGAEDDGVGGATVVVDVEVVAVAPAAVCDRARRVARLSGIVMAEALPEAAAWLAEPFDVTSKVEPATSARTTAQAPIIRSKAERWTRKLPSEPLEEGPAVDAVPPGFSGEIGTNTVSS